MGQRRSLAALWPVLEDLDQDPSYLQLAQANKPGSPPPARTEWARVRSWLIFAKWSHTLSLPGSLLRIRIDQSEDEQRPYARSSQQGYL